MINFLKFITDTEVILVKTIKSTTIRESGIGYFYFAIGRHSRCNLVDYKKNYAFCSALGK